MAEKLEVCHSSHSGRRLEQDSPSPQQIDRLPFNDLLREVIISRRGVEFRIKLLDFFDLGRPTRQRIQEDVVDLVHVLHEIIGGRPRYGKSGPEIKRIVCGLKRSLISRRFRTAGELRQAIDSLRWD